MSIYLNIPEHIARDEIRRVDGSVQRDIWTFDYCIRACSGDLRVVHHVSETVFLCRIWLISLAIFNL